MSMCKALDQAIEKIRALPPDRQEYAAGVLEEIAAGDCEPCALGDEEWALVREGLDDVDAGRVVLAADMEQFWNRHRK